jgi:hypothetical protein
MHSGAFSNLATVVHCLVCTLDSPCLSCSVDQSRIRSIMVVKASPRWCPVLPNSWSLVQVLYICGEACLSMEIVGHEADLLHRRSAVSCKIFSLLNKTSMMSFTACTFLQFAAVTGYSHFHIWSQKVGLKALQRGTMLTVAAHFILEPLEYSAIERHDLNVVQP